MTTEITKAQSAEMAGATGPADPELERFALQQRKAQALAGSSLVPQHFQGNVANCLIAVDMAERMGANSLMVAQNLYVVHGRPGWGSAFLIACINMAPGLSKLRFRLSGKEGSDQRTCVAYATDTETGELLESAPISIGMAKKEGWYSKSGSKWQTMPEQMLRYRAAAFFARTYAPELTMGIRTAEENEDIAAQQVTPANPFKPLDALPEPAPTEESPTPDADPLDGIDEPWADTPEREPGEEG